MLFRQYRFWCRSREGAWIEIIREAPKVKRCSVAPARERGLKYDLESIAGTFAIGRSREGAWIEIDMQGRSDCSYRCRSREGAWIEIISTCFFIASDVVAPARERGLKF